MTIPVFFPLLAQEYDVSGVVTGLILAMSPMMTIVSVPFINRYIETVGVEATIFTSGLSFSAAFCLMAIASWTATSSSFLAIAFLSAALVGISIAASIVGEQALLLRYSEKNEREKNLGMFRAGSGLGGLLSPILGAAMYAIGDFFAVFLFVGIGYFLICPFIYNKLYTSREKFLQEKTRSERENLAE
jgi:MFS family permease